MREMKDSGIPWIGKIPKDWKISPIKYICKPNSIKIGPFGSALANKTFANEKYNVYGQANLISGNFSATKNTVTKKTFNDLRNYEVLPDDICVSMMGTIGKCRIVPLGIKQGIMDSHLIKLRVENAVMLPEFFLYVYDKDLGGVCFKQMQYEKTGSIMDGLNTSIVKRLYITLPPVKEQHRIIDYLDSKCAKINSIKKNVESEIEVLKQYKQSVITKAVTKGLDKDVEMKDSGIPWIGKIPKDWTNKRIKYLLLARDGGSWGTDPTTYNKGTICMRIADFDFDNGEFAKKPVESLTRRVYTKRQIQKLQLQKNDICIEKSGGGEKTPVGRAVIFNKSYLALFANFMDRLRFDSSKVNPVFAEYWFRAWYSCKGSPYYINQTTGIQNINLTLMMSKEKMFFPPVHEQQRIADFLDAKCAKINSIIQKKQELLANLDTYKKSLIYEYVTGKKEAPAV